MHDEGKTESREAAGSGEPRSGIPRTEAAQDRHSHALESHVLDEESWNRTFDALPDLIAILDLDFRIVRANKAMADRLEITPTEAVGQTCYECVHGTDAPPSFCPHAQLLRDGQPHAQEVHEERLDGEFMVTVSPLHDAEGRLIGSVHVARDITERKEAGEALASRERLLRSVFRAIQDGVTVMDRELTVLQHNAATTKWVGRRFVGEKCYAAFRNRTSPCDGCSSLRAMRERKPVMMVGRASTENAPDRWVEVTSFPILDDEGNVLGVVEHARDVTERMQAEEALREAGARYRAIFEGVAEGILVADTETKRFTYANPAVCKMLGYAREELTRLSVTDIHPKESLDHVIAEFEAQTRREKPLAPDIPCLRKDGGVFHADIMTAPAVIDGRECNVGFLTDITERKRAEEELRESGETLRALVETSRDWIWSIDLHGVHTYCSPAIETILGYRVDELLGKCCFDFMHDDDKRMIEARLPGWVAEKQGWRDLLIRWRCKNGGLRYLESNAVPILDLQGEVVGFRGVDRDTTDRKRAEEERLQLEAQVQHAQKLESLGVMAGGIAHDFNNLLTALTGQAFLVEMGLPTDSPLRENIGIVQQVTKQASDLTAQLLAYSGRGKFAAGTVDLSALIGESTQILRLSITKGATLTYDLSEELPPIEADSSQLQQVLMNLAINASDAIGDRPGLISIATRAETLSATDLARDYIVDEPADGTYVCLEVRDSGCGMDAETCGKIFDPFFTSKQRGRGLGLAALLGIVRAHSGAIKVDSEPGAGTTFRVLFPAAQGAPAEPDRAKSPVEDWEASGYVLVVDDEEPVLATVRLLLENVGFDVHVAENGRQAVEVFREHADEIRAVVLDVTMPEMNGPEAFRAVREIRPDARVIMASGCTELDVSRRLSIEGVVGFLQKPYDPMALIQMLRETLES